ncbi:hypothetical protein JG687_00007200 [Phytophthora cactorum]|uniref:t-SNARE coiled-coil homology domain-containing protein n=1 Tax=Phytophthora cactorum TaxID=29920 RepID=A0A8T1UKY9_9STRA|nr:hypothetical protein JG687_00007200 [Phytophthora cactorum]
MATRELTRQFLQLRADEKAKVLRRKNIVSHREEGNALIKSADQEATSVAIAPGWVDVVNGTNQHVARIKEMMEKLNKLHTSRLMVRFDGQESKYEREIDQLTQDITDEFRSAEKGLRRMAQSDRNGEFSAADAKTRQNVQRALATQLQTLSGDFRKSQKTYLARVKNQKEGPVEFDFLAENDAKQKRRGGADTGFTQAQVTEVEIAEDVINERDQEIQRIATSITELATIFKELAVLVIDQGTILDRIDYNMEQVVEQTEKGIEELEKAEETQKNSRPVKCIGLLLVMIFVMTVEVKQQQALMRSLRVFVDALRDIKKTEDSSEVNYHVVEAVRVFCGSSETQNDVQWHDEAWRRGLVPTFQRLCLCMTRLDQLEAQERKKMGPQTPQQAEKPKAPAGLLSLRDYSVLQAAVELLFCWGVYPRVAAGVLMPIEKRRPTRTLEISKDVLMWGYRGYTQVVDAELKSEETTSELLGIMQALLQLLSLPQFQPILLPKYVVELLALLVYGEIAVDTKAPTPVQAEFIRLREMVLRVLPLRMSMSSLRAALGQATPAANEQMVGQRFKARCGNLLSRLLMEDGGIVATIEMMLGAVEEGNTQARMQVATLICQCPSGEDPEKYATALCTQVRELLLAAVTPEKGNTSSTLLGEMAALLADHVEGVEMVLMLLLALIEYLGPSVLRSAATVLQCIGTVLETYNTPAAKLVDTEQQDESVIQTEDDENEEEDEILTICLGVVTTILEAGSSDRSDAEEQQLRAMLPVLEVLSRHPRPEVAELASNARAQILSRGATDASDAKTTRTGEQSFEEVLREAEQDLSSQLVPLRARGVVTLTKLVRRSHSHVHDAEWTPRVHALAQVFLLHLHDSESYVYLAAVQGLAALADAHPNVAVPALVKALQDPENSLESRIKLSEALLFSAKRCGETLPKYGQLFVYAYLDCIRPPPSQRKRVERIQNKAAKRVQLIQEVQSDEEKTAATKELQHPTKVCALLQWGLQPFLLDVLTCVFGVLQLELELGGKRRPKPGASDATEDDEQQRLRKQQRVVAVRRGAVFVLRYLVELLGWKMLELMPDQLSPLYHTLKYVARVDRDRVVVFHADRALRALDEVMRSELFPRVEQQDAAFGISSLRIV